MSIGTDREAFAKGNEGDREVFITDDMLSYLDDLRESGVTNMLGAKPYVQRKFPELTSEQAAEVLGYWMKTVLG